MVFQRTPMHNVPLCAFFRESIKGFTQIRCKAQSELMDSDSAETLGKCKDKNSLMHATFDKSFECCYYYSYY